MLYRHVFDVISMPCVGALSKVTCRMAWKHLLRTYCQTASLSTPNNRKVIYTCMLCSVYLEQDYVIKQ